MTARKSIRYAFTLIVCAIIVNDFIPKIWECGWELLQSVAWLFVFSLFIKRFLFHYKSDWIDRLYLAMASGLLAFQCLTIIDETYSAFIKYKYYSLPANLYYQKIDEGFDLYNGFYWLVLLSVWICTFVIILCNLRYSKDAGWEIEDIEKMKAT